MVQVRTVKIGYFNVFQLGAETPMAPGSGENWFFGETFGR